MSKHLSSPIILDCTLRDGGYYNCWNFSLPLVNEYLVAMKAAQVDVLELGFRFLKNEGFKGACAFTTDNFLHSLIIPSNLEISVMANGSDLCSELGCFKALEYLFPLPCADSAVDIVRLACHFRELDKILPATDWLSNRGYRVCLNLMQITDRTHDEIHKFACMANNWPVDVLYFADSLGSMNPDDVAQVVSILRCEWKGHLGIHAHDNMGLALSNTMRASREGVAWLDSTVTGMGRGPGNVRTEELVVEVDSFRGDSSNISPLMSLISHHFAPMKAFYGWGPNIYYYLAGKYGIHPTYIQNMVSDTRFGDDDILAALVYLRAINSREFSSDSLESSRHFYSGDPQGSWNPADIIEGREVLILGTGPGVSTHRTAIEAYVRRKDPIVLALNTQSGLDPSFITLRIACHPVRLLADVENHVRQPQPLITPVSMLPKELQARLSSKQLLDYGLSIKPGFFEFHDYYCVSPSSLVLAYALAVATSGRSTRILLAGFDGYQSGDPRNHETGEILDAYRASVDNKSLIAVTPTNHHISTKSIYSLSL